MMEVESLILMIEIILSILKVQKENFIIMNQYFKINCFRSKNKLYVEKIVVFSVERLFYMYWDV